MIKLFIKIQILTLKGGVPSSFFKQCKPLNKVKFFNKWRQAPTETNYDVWSTTWQWRDYIMKGGALAQLIF